MAGTGAQKARAGAEEQLVVFRLADESYGVDINSVREIITWQPVTRMPGTPRFIEGVLNLRGSVIPVIDLRKRFEFPEQAHTAETRIMVVEIEGQVVGLVVDAVTEVLRVPSEAIEAPDGFALGVNAAFLRGVAKVGERLIVLLQLDGLLEAEERAALRRQTAAADAGGASAVAAADGGGVAAGAADAVA